MSEKQVNKKQKLLLEYLISDKEAFVKCVRIMKDSYFEAPLDRVAEFLIEYFSKYHSIPDIDQIEGETGIALVEREMDDDERSYFLDEFESLCRDSAMEQAIFESVEYLKDGKNSEIPDLVRNALLVRIDSSVGTNIFSDPMNRISNMDSSVEETSIGIDSLDKLTNFVRRGELGLFFAETGGGKSVMLANVGNNFAKRGLDTFIVSIELGEDLYAKRLDAIVTGIDISDHAKKASDIAEILVQAGSENYGNIVVKKVPFGVTHEDIRSYVMEYHLEYGKYPDVLVVDYLGLMGARGKSFSNRSEEDEIKAFGIRDILQDFNIYGFSAGQINRDGYDVKTLGPQHIAGGISVINASDWAIGLVASEEDIDNNQVQAIQMKVRNGGKTRKPVTLYRCPRTLRMSDRPFAGQSIRKEEPSGEPMKNLTKQSSSTAKERLGNVLNRSKTKR